MSMCLILATALTLSPTGDPPNRRVPADAIPASAYVGIEFAGLEACRRELDGFLLANVFEPMLAPAREAAVAAAQEQLRMLDEALARVQLDRGLVRQLARRPLAVGLGRVTFFDDEVVPSIAVAIDIDGIEPAAHQIVRSIARLLQDRRGLERTRTEHGDAFVHTLRHPRKNGNLTAAFSDKLLLLGNSPIWVEHCLDCWTGTRERLTAVAARRRGIERLRGDALLAATINLQAVRGVLPIEADAIAGALGVDGHERIFVGTSLGERSSRDLAYLASDHEPGGIAAALSPSRVDTAAAAYCPPDALVFATGSIDAVGLEASLVALFEALPTEARSNLRRAFTRALHRDLGRLPPTAHGVLDRLRSSQCRWIVSFPIPGPTHLIPHPLVVLDTPNAVEIVADFAEALQLEALDFRGTTVHFARLDAGIRLNPAICVHDRRIVASSDILTLKAALARRAGDKPSLADVDPPEPGSGQSLVEVRTHVALENYWSVVRAFSHGIAARHAGIDPSAIPEVEEIVAATDEVRLELSRHDRGIDLWSESPCGTATWLAYAADFVDRLLAADV